MAHKSATKPVKHSILPDVPASEYTGRNMCGGNSRQGHYTGCGVRCSTCGGSCAQRAAVAAGRAMIVATRTHISLCSVRAKAASATPAQPTSYTPQPYPVCAPPHLQPGHTKRLTQAVCAQLGNGMHTASLHPTCPLPGRHARQRAGVHPAPSAWEPTPPLWCGHQLRALVR